MAFCRFVSFRPIHNRVVSDRVNGSTKRIMPHPKRLLFVTERFEPDIGGVARSATRTAQALSRLACQVQVLGLTRSLPAGESEHRVIGADESTGGRVDVCRLGQFASQDYTLQHALTVMESLQQHAAFDAVWGHYLSPAGFLAVLFGRLMDIPAVVSARGNDVDLLMFPPGDFARLTWTLNHATIVSAVSKDLANKIRVITDGKLNVRVIPNSVDSRLFCRSEPDIELRLSLGIGPEDLVLGFSGELRHKKGLLPMLRAFAQVAGQRSAVLLVIGDVRAREQQTLVAFTADHPELRDRIIITGHLELQRDVQRHLQLCDLVLQPSHWDGMPNSILEAMTCERIVLASDAGGMAEVIDNGRTGFLLPRHQLDQLGEAILELSTLSPSPRLTIGRSAREQVCQKFSPEREAAVLEELLAELWCESKRPS